eukprot:29188-Pelagococcus_subviridis.AAC.2
MRALDALAERLHRLLRGFEVDDELAVVEADGLAVAAAIPAAGAMRVMRGVAAAGGFALVSLLLLAELASAVSAALGAGARPRGGRAVDAARRRRGDDGQRRERRGSETPPRGRGRRRRRVEIVVVGRGRRRRDEDDVLRRDAREDRGGGDDAPDADAETARGGTGARARPDRGERGDGGDRYHEASPAHGARCTMPAATKKNPGTRAPTRREARRARAV